MKKTGFTLIELLVVVSITTLLGIMFTDVLIQALRGENKIKILSQVKQNGQVVLDKLTGDIRQAETILCGQKDNGPDIDNNAKTDTLVVFKQGVYTRYRYFKPENNSPKKNGYIAADYFTADDYPKITEARCADPLQDSRVSFLTDTDLIAGVSIDTTGETGYYDNIFKKDTLDGYKDAVTIRFKISAGLNAGSSYEYSVKEGGVLFSTTVGIRTKK